MSFESIRALGGDNASTALPPQAEQLRALPAAWDQVANAIDEILAAKPLLESANATRGVVLDAAGRIHDSGRAIVAEKLRIRAPASEVAAAGEIATLARQLAKETLEFSGSIGGAAAVPPGLGLTLEALTGAVERFPARVAATESELAQIRLQLDRFVAPLQRLLNEAGVLARVGFAERQVQTDVEALRGRLTELRRDVPQAAQASGWKPLTAAGLGLLAAFAALALSRAYARVSNARAVAAERQREVAERLQLDAKRMNDQNQAAILRLMNELQEVADGDLTVQATVTEDITGAIADSVNYTVEELRSLVSRINTTAELVNDASSKAQITAASLQSASEQQSREISETGEAVLRMAQQINEVSSRAAESVKVARQSLSASQEGSRAVNHAIGGMNVIRDQIQETAKRIKRLGESSQEIGEIVEMISDLTEQTNTLALNAAIQAASAGEAGRGFTIVAEEVQRLAERSAEATKQISGLIKTIQSDTQDAVAAMERSTQGVVEGTRRSDEAGGALEQIGAVSAQLAELIEGFSATTSRQAASAGTVAQAIQRILMVTEQTSKGTSQTAGSIRQLSELAQELKNSVSRFKVG